MSAPTKPIVEVKNLSKLYQLGNIGASSLREALEHWWMKIRKKEPVMHTPHPSIAAHQIGARPNTFWSLKDISFEVNRGEVVGIIGRNGAGKSTLLKVLSRITEPTQGEITLRGRVVSLLEVGTGFHPELTGRENIFLNGAILGMKRSEIARKFDEIVEFAEVGSFIDTPVKRYSSGMYVRLAFAVAAHLEPEILIIDEVLAVGDADFQKKCLGKMREVAHGEGRTVLFVSHNMNAVANLCDSAILLEAGRIVERGPTERVIERYSSSTDTRPMNDLSKHNHRATGVQPYLQRIDFTDSQAIPTTSFGAGDPVRMTMIVKCAQRIRQPRLGIGFTDARGERVFAIATYLSPSMLEPVEGLSAFTAEFQMPAVMPGKYHLDISFSDKNEGHLDEIPAAASIDVVENNFLGTSHPYFREMGYVLVKSKWHTTVLESTEEAAGL